MKTEPLNLEFLLTLTSITLINTVCSTQHLSRTVTLERIETTAPCRPDFATCSFTLEPSPKNRFSKVVNFKMTLVHRVLATNLFIEAVLFKLSGNEYKRTAIYYKRNFCDFVAQELQMFIKHDTSPVFKDFQPTCPMLEPQTYFIRNYTLDPSGISSLLKMVPLWSIKLQITLTGCPSSKLYNNRTWSEGGEIICYRTSVFSSIHEV